MKADGDLADTAKGLFSSVIGELDEAAALVDADAAAAGLGPGRVAELHLAFEEAWVNICTHAYPSAPGPIETRTRRAAGHFHVDIIDEGPAFDPLARAEPDFAVDLGERPVGGLGVHLIRSLIDGVQYRREGSRNVLTMTMDIEPRTAPK
jgi:serine/threonine-protein kinase RsbW